MQFKIDRLFDKFHRFLWLLPLYSGNICVRALSNGCHKVLDIGCGQGRTGRTLKRLRPSITFILGVDIHLAILKVAKQNRTHDDYILCDIRSMPFRTKMFDAVLCLEVLEHLSKHEGSVLIEQLEQIAVKRIILTTPAVFLKQEPFGGNPWQKHKTFWTPHELENRSCKVAGFGLRFLFVRNSERVLGITALIAFLVSLVFSPLVYFMPQQLAYETSAYKSLIPLSRNKVIE